MEQQRKRIAWCGDCGNLSVDGINFSEAEPAGWLECLHCGATGPFAYYQEASLQARHEDEPDRILCSCKTKCGDMPEEDDHPLAVCKTLPVR